MLFPTHDMNRRDVNETTYYASGRIICYISVSISNCEFCIRSTGTPPIFYSIITASSIFERSFCQSRFPLNKSLNRGCLIGKGSKSLRVYRI